MKLQYSSAHQCTGHIRFFNPEPSKQLFDLHTKDANKRIRSTVSKMPDFDKMLTSSCTKAFEKKKQKKRAMQITDFLILNCINLQIKM